MEYKITACMPSSCRSFAVRDRDASTSDAAKRQLPAVRFLPQPPTTTMAATSFAASTLFSMKNQVALGTSAAAFASIYRDVSPNQADEGPVFSSYWRRHWNW